MNAQALVLTDNAANKVRQLRDSEGNQDLMLRCVCHRWWLFRFLLWL